jgi:hypothetical protein
MPTTGSCAFLITLPVPYGLVDVTSYAETGYNFMGIINFTSSSSGILSGTVENAIYKTNDSPDFGPPVYVKDAVVSISPMTDSNGFIGGSKIIVNGIRKKAGTAPKQVQFILNAVATNGVNTILLQTSGTTPGPGSGVCQF